MQGLYIPMFRVLVSYSDLQFYLRRIWIWWWRFAAACYGLLPVVKAMLQQKTWIQMIWHALLSYIFSYACRHVLTQVLIHIHLPRVQLHPSLHPVRKNVAVFPEISAGIDVLHDIGKPAAQLSIRAHHHNWPLCQRGMLETWQLLQSAGVERRPI